MKEQILKEDTWNFIPLDEYAGMVELIGGCGQIGKVAWFRPKRMWGFESLHPHSFFSVSPRFGLLMTIGTQKTKIFWPIIITDSIDMINV